jgi:hypothetical protein
MLIVPDPRVAGALKPGIVALLSPAVSTTATVRGSAHSVIARAFCNDTAVIWPTNASLMP